MSDGGRAQLTRAFFAELVRDRSLESRFCAAERKRWAAQLLAAGQGALVVELETYLRGLAAYFNLHHQPIADLGTVVARDFQPELGVVKAALERLLQLGPRLAPELDRRGHFRRYLTTLTANEAQRGRVVVEALQQRSPEESLAVLFDGLAALRELVAALAAQPYCNLSVFRAVGALTARELGGSRFFSPFMTPLVRPERERLRNVPLLEALAALRPAAARRLLVAQLLALLRCLRYLDQVPALGAGQDPAALTVLALVHAEAQLVAARLAALTPERLAGWTGAAAFCAAVVPAAQALLRDLRQILLAGQGQAERAAAGAAVSAAMLATALEGTRAMIDIPLGLRPADARPEPAASERQALARLRQDLWVLCRLLGALGQGDEALPIEPLSGFLGYVRGVSRWLLPASAEPRIERLLGLAAQARTAPSLASARRLRAEAAEALPALQGLLAELDAAPALAGLPFERAAAEALHARFWS